MGDKTEDELRTNGGWIDMAGIGRAVEHFQRSGCEVVALVPKIWHTSKAGAYTHSRSSST
jgi:hypothetical protein